MENESGRLFGGDLRIEKRPPTDRRLSREGVSGRKGKGEGLASEPNSRVVLDVRKAPVTNRRVSQCASFVFRLLDALRGWTLILRAPFTGELNFAVY